MSRCASYNTRHWFSFYGQPGLRSPACVRCGAPNPRKLTEEQWDELIWFRDNVHTYPFADPIEKALDEHREEAVSEQP
jgi:hypothetical protein